MATKKKTSPKEDLQGYVATCNGVTLGGNNFIYDTEEQALNEGQKDLMASGDLCNDGDEASIEICKVVALKRYKFKYGITCKEV